MYFILREYIGENLGKMIGKENFVVKLLEIFLYFYKLLIVINVFKLVGIYFVDSIVIIYEMLKFLLIYIDKVVIECVEVLVVKRNLRNKRKLKVYLRFFRVFFLYLFGSVMLIN